MTVLIQIIRQYIGEEALKEYPHYVLDKSNATGSYVIRMEAVEFCRENNIKIKAGTVTKQCEYIKEFVWEFRFKTSEDKNFFLLKFGDQYE